jgi:hypothetical protein
MKVIKLPPVLPGDIDLQAINQQLQDRIAQLDWSAVTSASDSALVVLLKGLDISDDADILGIDGTIPDSLVDRILAIANQQPTHTSESNEKDTTGSSSPSPEVWMPTDPETAHEETSDESLIYSSKDDESPQASAKAEKYRVFQKATPAEIRRQLEDAIIKELHGPVQGEDEEVDEAHVTDRYLVGVLAPILRNKSVEIESEPAVEDSPEQQDSLALADKDNAEEGNTDTNIPTTDSMFPSSMGMTFCISAEAQALEIQAEWGCYIRQASEISFTDKGNPKQIWKRYPLKGTVILELEANQEIDEIPVPDQAPSVYLRGQIRRLPDGDWMISVFLVNGQHEPDQNKDTAWLFQPELSVRSANVDAPDIFIRKPLEQHTAALDPVIQAENQAMAMLYRNQVEFAVGHGVGIHAELAPDTPTRAVCLSTSIIPNYEVPATNPPTEEEIPALKGLVLDMKRLSEASDTELVRPCFSP